MPYITGWAVDFDSALMQYQTLNILTGQLTDRSNCYLIAMRFAKVEGNWILIKNQK